MNEQKRNILVTGAAGYIGTHVLLALYERGYTEGIVPVDNFVKSDPAYVPFYTPVRADIRDEHTMAELFQRYRFDAVIHLAAHTEVAESVHLPFKYYDTNLGGTISLLRLCRQFNVAHFIFSSTAAVYQAPESQQALTEDSALAPENPYGRSKQLAEEMIRSWAGETGGTYINLRYFNVAGADPQMRAGQYWPEATHLIKVAAQVATNKRGHLQIYGADYPTEDGTCVRDYVHVTDLAEAHCAALNHIFNGGASNTLNCGYGDGTSVKEVIDTIRSRHDPAFPFYYAQRRAGDPAYLVADNRRIREILDWQPRYADLDKIIDTAFRWENGLNAHYAMI